MKNNKEELILNKAKLNDIPKVIRFVEIWAGKNDVNIIAPALLTAVDEACSNIIKYTYSDKGGYLSVSCYRDADSASIQIRDKGKAFDPAFANQPDISSDLQDRPVGGLGIYLIKKLMDEVVYSSDRASGNILTLRKMLGKNKT